MRNTVATLVLFATLATGSGSTALAGETAPTVAVETGKLTGICEQGVNVYRGIPYAKPPVGALRWRAPRPAEPWPGILAADGFGPACQQPGRANATRSVGDLSEDCLTLNVWTRSLPTRVTRGASGLPVMVWIHGGGFVRGSGALQASWGAHLAQRNVVLVSINYRLGIFGFFSHPILADEVSGEAEGNYGLMDMVAALRWVQRNIASFGGDANNVTIFGVSAGGMAVDTLMAMPSAAGLFHRAIAQSGYGTWPLPHLSEARFGLPSAREAGAALIESVAPVPPNRAAIRGIRSLDANTLISARAGFFTPIVDGELLPEEPGIVFAKGKQHDVPFMTGGNAYEGTIWGAFNHTPDVFLASFGTREKRARELYSDDLAINPRRGASRMFGDNRYVLAGRYLARQMAMVSSPAYLYYFSFVPDADRGRLPGAAHGSETPLVFGLGDDAEVLDRYGESGEKLSLMMTSYWVQFARTGNPNGGAVPQWPTYEEKTDRWLELTSPPAVREGLLAEKLDLLEATYLDRVGSIDRATK